MVKAKCIHNNVAFELVEYVANPLWFAEGTFATKFINVVNIILEYLIVAIKEGRYLKVGIREDGSTVVKCCRVTCTARLKGDARLP
ncbi:hypothetical protein SFRURICE_009985, partial [Spodoptera frugiperda]